MSSYVCAELADRLIHGYHNCAVWVEQPISIIEVLAITREQAQELTLAICALIIIGYVGGLIGRAMRDV